MSCGPHESHVMTCYMKIVQESYSSADRLVLVSTAFTYDPKKLRHQDRERPGPLFFTVSLGTNVTWKPAIPIGICH